MNKLATIETLHSVSVHGNADNLELAKVLGFQVVTKKGDFTEGQKVIFIWPDTIVQPADWNRFLDKYNENKPIRIKSCKLRGQFSTGLVLPVTVLNDYQGVIEDGHEVADYLGVTKYVKDDGNLCNGESAGAFPSHLISKTDEDLAQSSPQVYKEFLGKPCYLTQKIDGQSLTLISYNGEITVCSRNQMIKEGESKFWRTVRKYDLIEKLRGLNVAIQAEQFGHGIQGNPYGLPVNEINLMVFNVKNLDTGEFMGLVESEHFCDSLKIPHVLLLQNFVFDENTAFDSLQVLADSQKYPNGNHAEGIVLRPCEPCFSPTLGRMLSVKFINRNYKD